LVVFAPGGTVAVCKTQVCWATAGDVMNAIARTPPTMVEDNSLAMVADGIVILLLPNQS
jgi:hypothetical protein